MKYTNIIPGAVLLSGMLIGNPVFADKHDKSDMSMMGGGQAGTEMGPGPQSQMPMASSPGNMSNPMMQMMMMQMMQMMMQQQGNRMSMHGGQGGHHGGMGMMGGKQGGMGMMGGKQGMGMMGGKQGGMGMMGGKQGGMGMMGGDHGDMPKMMQEKQAEMKQHMQSMETKLGNIEALLQELVDLQKSS